ncbi:NfeD family protein [Hahella sp. SMD15-11]|uniref:NfeD family protein n=1 Tax=Thermohahella caldifontis TaxID=3142973 RepID=A0AB39USH9_9GAMM
MTVEMLLEGLTRWEWWAIAGIILLVAEAFSSTEFMVWIGLAALTLALIAASVEPRWEVNLVLFSGLSFVYTLLGRRYWRKVGKHTDDPTLNHRSLALVGRVCTVAERVTEAEGRVRVGDTTWSAVAAPGKGPFEPGTEVRVIAARGTLLIVDDKPA